MYALAPGTTLCIRGTRLGGSGNGPWKVRPRPRSHSSVAAASTRNAARRAESLRASILSTEEERANTATTVLYIPTSLLVFVLFIIAAYPFLVRLVTT